jgi:hypothetical protein
MIVWVFVLIATLWFAIPEVIMRESDRRRKLREGTPDEPETGNSQAKGR